MRILGGAGWAWQVARQELASTLPLRWARSRAVTGRASELAARLDTDPELLLSAACLHHVGYAPRLAHTGFHPLDGARFLRDEHAADPALTSLVAHQTAAALGAQEHGLRAELDAEFPLPDTSVLLDALTYCDMTVDEDGLPTTAAARIAHIRARHSPDSPVGRFILRAEPVLLETCARVEAALGVGAQPTR